MSGVVTDVLLKPQSSRRMIRVKARPVRVIQGKGIYGDHAKDKDKMSFIASEFLAKDQSESQDPSLTSPERHIVTKNIKLGKLIGKKFQCGTVTFEGLGPFGCTHDPSQTTNEQVEELGNLHGILASPLTDGEIRVNAAIKLLEP